MFCSEVYPERCITLPTLLCNINCATMIIQRLWCLEYFTHKRNQTINADDLYMMTKSQGTRGKTMLENCLNFLRMFYDHESVFGIKITYNTFALSQYWKFFIHFGTKTLKPLYLRSYRYDIYNGGTNSVDLNFRHSDLTNSIAKFLAILFSFGQFACYTFAAEQVTHEVNNRILKVQRILNIFIVFRYGR